MKESDLEKPVNLVYAGRAGLKLASKWPFPSTQACQTCLQTGKSCADLLAEAKQERMARMHLT